MTRLEKVNKDKKFIATISEEEMHQRELNTERYLGEKNAKLETAKNLINSQKLNIAEIAEFTGLSIREVQDLI